MLTKSREHSRDFFCICLFSVLFCHFLGMSAVSTNNCYLLAASAPIGQYPSPLVFFRQRKRQSFFEFFINVCDGMFAGVEKC